MDPGTYWFVLSPLGAVMTGLIAFTMVEGDLRLFLLGVAVLEAAPLLLLLGVLAVSVVHDAL